MVSVARCRLCSETRRKANHECWDDSIRMCYDCFTLTDHFSWKNRNSFIDYLSTTNSIRK